MIQPTMNQKDTAHPLTSVQRGLYTRYRIDPSSVAFNVPALLKIEGVIDESRLQSAFAKVLNAHGCVRCAFEFSEGELRQRPVAISGGRIEVANISEKQLGQAINRFIRPFDLAAPPLMRVLLASHSLEHHHLCIDVHHIAVDVVGRNTLLQDFFAAYSGKSLSAAPSSYFDFAHWEDRSLKTDAFVAEQSYWSNRLTNVQLETRLPGDVPPGFTLHPKAFQVPVELPQEVATQIKRLAEHSNSTQYLVLLAAFSLFVRQMSGQRILCIGVPSSSRYEHGFEDAVGNFVNLLPIVLMPEESQTFYDLSAKLKSDFFEAIENQNYPLDLIIRDLHRRTHDVADINTVFVRSEGLEQFSDVEGITVREVNFGFSECKYDLSGYASFQSPTSLLLEFSEARFTERAARYFAEKCGSSIASSLQNPNGPINSLRQLEQTEFCLSTPPVPSDPETSGVVAMFSFRALTRPDSIAAVQGDRHLSFAMLDRASDRISNFLVGKGFPRGSCIGVRLGRSLEMLTAVIGILKARCTFVPLSVDLPGDRVTATLARCGAVAVLDPDRKTPCPTGCEPFSFNRAVSEIREFAVPMPDPSDAAYIFFTSGSTGEPKGVVLNHRNLSNLLVGLQNEYPADSESAYIVKTPSSFDVSIPELFSWFYGAGKAVLLDDGAEKDPAAIAAVLRKERVTHVNFVPSMLAAFYELANSEQLSALHSTKQLFLAGEVLPPGLADPALRAGVAVHNLYGPTECTTYSTVYSLTAADDQRSIPIGLPVAGTGCYILDGDLNGVWLGVHGELYLSGLGIGEGYVNEPRLTAEVFIPDLLLPGKRMYKTGDGVRRNYDDFIEFIGRGDRQVKIRGNRVELGEIEHHIARYPGIQACIVDSVLGNSGIPSLTAVCQTRCNITTKNLLQFIGTKLPSYMIPSRILFVTEFPLTTSGKLDRKRLLAETVAVNNVLDTGIAEGDELCGRIKAIWRDLVEIDEIGVDSDFFELGGHSLTAIRCAAKISSTFSVPYTVRMMFDTPTIRATAAFIRDAQANREVADTRPEHSHR